MHGNMASWHVNLMDILSKYEVTTPEATGYPESLEKLHDYEIVLAKIAGASIGTEFLSVFLNGSAFVHYYVAAVGQREA